jgi:hypothetical protein
VLETKVTRRTCLLLGAGGVLWSTSLDRKAQAAEALAVPVALQAQLLSQVASYQRGFGNGAATAKLIILIRKGNADSERTGIQMQNAVKSIGKLGGLSAETSIATMTDMKGFMGDVTRERPAAIYVATGFESEISSIRDSLGTQSILTVSAMPSDVDRGIVLGFDLIASRPKLVINLGQARKQSLDFSAQLLRIAKVIP